MTRAEAKAIALPIVNSWNRENVRRDCCEQLRAEIHELKIAEGLDGSELAHAVQLLEIELASGFQFPAPEGWCVEWPGCDCARCLPNP